MFHFRGGFCSRRFLVAWVHWSIVPFARASTAPKPATHTSRHKNLSHTHRGSQKSRTYPSRHSHCPVGAVPLILPAHVVQSCWLCCEVTRSFINRSYHNRCERRNRAQLLRSSSRLQPWQSRQPCVVAAVPVLNAGQAAHAEAEVVSSSVKTEWQ